MTAAYAVPAGGVLGTRTTDFFCGAMAHGSRLLWRPVEQPAAHHRSPCWPRCVWSWGCARDLAAGGAAAPGAPAGVGPGPDVRAARMYVTRLRLFLGIGVLFLPISVVITLLQACVLSASSILGVETEGAGARAVPLLVAGRSAPR